MDKILAFSIMSSSPAEIAGAGAYATRLSWRSAGTKQQQQKADQSSRPEKMPEVMRALRFAPEFDGINCFESIIVSF